ncbi:sensor histidine kinase [Streptomyces sp. KR55]|uniref:sensor histidine kinase n=1 Tax=Streptomyces sp. KR55 TaxID=3457425 RepID=UPI003FD1B732
MAARTVVRLALTRGTRAISEGRPRPTATITTYVHQGGARLVGSLPSTLRRGDSTHDPTDEEVEAPPGLASLGTLLAHHEAAGLTITVDTAGARRPLGGPADQAAYRILQEALTNAARHGTGHRARIQFTYTKAGVDITVTNPRSARHVNGSPRPGGGHGLIGMRERVTLLGGSLEAGHRDGTFRVHARIPAPAPDGVQPT